MRTFGLIGKKLGHSFSKKYFTEKFLRERIQDTHYELFEISDISQFPSLLRQNPSICGLNVTIPYKQEIIPFLDGLDETAQKVGAVNVVKLTKAGKLIGYNSDLIGFAKSFQKFCPDWAEKQALVLGNGGAAKAVCAALSDWEIPYKLVSRQHSATTITYQDISEEIIDKHSIIVNTTPLGTYPQIETKPDLPYQAIGSNHFMYDLVYNPETTAFMKAGQELGAKAKNGLEMLRLQAEAAWEVWNRDI